MTTMTVGSGPAALQSLRAPYAGPMTVSLSDEARKRIDAGRQVIDDAIRNGDVVYGVNTGFGKLADRRISPDDLLELQRRVITSHMVGVGAPLPDDAVRATLLLKLMCLVQGHSGVRQQTVDLLVAMLNEDILPVVPSQGSVGASGDLAPLSHLVGAMTGIGKVRYRGQEQDAALALRSAGLEPIELGPKEGVALINGTQASTALALKGLFHAENVFNAAIVAGALTLEATAGRQTALDARIQTIRRQVGQIRAAAALRDLVADSVILAEEFPGRRLQDPYCLRCMPQVMGASLDLLEHSASVLERESAAVSDNPLMFPEDGIVLSGGNFHGQPVAFAADIVAMALCEIGSLSERRTAMLMDTSMSGLPPFLVQEAGLNSGFLMAQVTSAALVAENRSRAFPGSVDSIPTSAGQEDHVSMATHTARRLEEMSMNAAYVVAIELLSGVQGVELRDRGPVAAKLRPAYELVRAVAEPLTKDRVMAGEMEAVGSQVISGAYNEMAGITLLGDGADKETAA
jgi:histidine ammonia-lyase